MNELESITNCLHKIEKLLYGINYECHFQFKALAESADVEDAKTNLASEFKNSFIEPVSYSEFKKEVNLRLQYEGGKHSGPNFTEKRLLELKEQTEKLWQLMEQKFNPGKTVVYNHTPIQTWIFWDFCFLIVSRERNRIYLFEGGASD